MKLAICALLTLLVAAPVLAAEGPSELVASFSWVDSTEGNARDILAAGSLTFPVFKHFSLGPALDYRRIRFDSPNVEAAPPVSLAPENGTHLPEPTPQAATTEPADDSLSIWSIGARAVLYTTPDHEGVYFAAEALFPQGDAEGELWTAEGGFQGIFGDGKGVDGLLRVAYKRAWHRVDHDEFIDLGNQQVTAGFGISY